jgi:hypothetical protein
VDARTATLPTSQEFKGVFADWVKKVEAAAAKPKADPSKADLTPDQIEKLVKDMPLSRFARMLSLPQVVKVAGVLFGMIAAVASAAYWFATKFPSK